MTRRLLLICLLVSLYSVQVFALARPDIEFKIFQFPANMIPRIDGDPSDWDIVPDSYAIGMDELVDLVNNFPVDKSDVDLTVTVGWVKGMPHLYFLVEAYDDWWNFDNPTLLNDLFEIVVDADLSGGPIIKSAHPDKDVIGTDELHYTMHGVHAQNYHIFIPPGAGKNWAFVWGSANWLKELPWSNSACKWDFEHGESGNLVLEFWITPFDHATSEGPGKAVVSKLEENGIIGLTWGRSDYDNTWDPNGKDPGNVNLNDLYDGQFNLSHQLQWFTKGTDLCAFRLMPLEKQFLPAIKAKAAFRIIDMDRHMVAFTDQSIGDIKRWTWDFGDGEISHKQHPVHQFNSPGRKNVMLTVEGPAGKDIFPFVWEEIFLVDK